MPQTLVEVVPKSPALEVDGQNHFIQALVELIAKSQALQVARQPNLIQTLVETWGLHGFAQLKNKASSFPN